MGRIPRAGEAGKPISIRATPQERGTWERVARAEGCSTLSAWSVKTLNERAAVVLSGEPTSARAVVGPSSEKKEALLEVLKNLNLVIFLDIDGVLNSEGFLRKLEELHRQLGHLSMCECFRLGHLLDRDAIRRLNRLVEVTGAKIVISSSWRKLLDPIELHGILREHGLVADIAGQTPDSFRDPDCRVIYEGATRILRGHEIDRWLSQHPEVDRFVILDDGLDMAMHNNRLVQTGCEEGFLDEQVELAIVMLLGS